MLKKDPSLQLYDIGSFQRKRDVELKPYRFYLDVGGPLLVLRQKGTAKSKSTFAATVTEIVTQELDLTVTVDAAPTQ